MDPFLEGCRVPWRSGRLIAGWSSVGVPICLHMTSTPNESIGHSHHPEDLPPVNETAVAKYLKEEAAIYLEAGEFYFRNPTDLGIQLLINWFNDVAESSPERRWAALEMLALYGLSASDATGGLPLSDIQVAELVASVGNNGPLREDFEYAAIDVITLLQSGLEPTVELPLSWRTYRHVLPAVFATACLVFAALTLEMVREVAKEEKVEPAEMWTEWIASSRAI